MFVTRKEKDDITVTLILGPEKGRKSYYISSERNKGGSRGSWQVHKVPNFERKGHI